MRPIVSVSGIIAKMPQSAERYRTIIMSHTAAKLPRKATIMPLTILACQITLMYVSPNHSASMPAGGGFSAR